MITDTQAALTTAQDVPTRAAAELAWSRDEPHTEPTPYQRPWRSAWIRALLLVLVGLAIGGAVWAVGWHKPVNPYTAPTVHVQPSVPAPAEPPAKPDPLTPTDHLFLIQLDGDGIPPRTPGTDGSAIATAEAICRAFNQGDTFTHLRELMSQRYLTPEQATAYIQDAVEFYCPRAMGSH